MTLLFIRTVFHKWHLNSDINNNLKNTMYKNYKINMPLFFFWFCRKIGSQSTFFFKHQPWHFSLILMVSSPCCYLNEKIKTAVLKNNSCSKCEKKRSLYVEFAFKQRQGRSLRTKSGSVKNKRCSVRHCRQRFSFQLLGGRAVGAETLML